MPVAFKEMKAVKTKKQVRWWRLYKLQANYLFRLWIPQAVLNDIQVLIFSIVLALFMALVVTK
ncbi:MAG: hypothetical protein POELPBGB_03220 [Bacteroidia bacterium]|nr:hypothetical protein [Bacteroidia bacterium]